MTRRPIATSPRASAHPCFLRLHAPAAFIAVMLCLTAYAVDVYEPMDNSIYAVLRNGRAIYLECTPPQGNAQAEEYFAKLLSDAEQREIYTGKGRVVVPFDSLNAEAQRQALLSIFKHDYVDETGWVHQVRFAGEGNGQETLWTLCAWLTGDGYTQAEVLRSNGLTDSTLTRGQTLLFPTSLLREVMRTPTRARIPHEAVDLEPELADLDMYASMLEYGEDGEGRFALYRLQPGDASLYTPVVVRFTDYRENEDILAACEIIQRRSDIRDVRDMELGQPVKIPLEMMSARFLPEDRPERIAYEASLREAARLRQQPVLARDLEGVVVILDPGHGGVDPGAKSYVDGHSLLEDELNYDIAYRIEKLLKEETRARVYTTVRDSSQGEAPVNTRRFIHDEDEQLVTTPPYANTDPTRSANLRWYLSNDIYRRETANGIEDRKVIFTSIHCDALFNESLRGAMIYIPGADYRKEWERPGPASFYDGFQEARSGPAFTSTEEQRRRDEALSRNFAELLYDELGRHRVQRHKGGAPIRNVIRRSGGRYYVPAVLRNNIVPTKILLETANMTNATDRERLSDPDWRQMVAEAYVSALKKYFAS